MKFSDICLITDDVLRLAQFYETVFGGTVEGDATHAVVTASGLAIAIYRKSDAESVMGFDFSGAGRGLLTINFNADDADEECARIRSMGLFDVTEPTLWPWGAKSFRLFDSDGNIIVIRSRPKQGQPQ
jgi:predicted enzyme related to lactoylglutathione lyase